MVERCAARRRYSDHVCTASSLRDWLRRRFEAPDERVVGTLTR
jgi:hypothetical protein